MTSASTVVDGCFETNNTPKNIPEAKPSPTMSSIGPQLPPHLAKRKRSPEDGECPDSPPTKTPRANQDEIALDDGGDSDSDDAYGPSAPKPQTASAPARPAIGPTLPPTAAASNTDEIALDSNSDDDDDDTGPAPPPHAAAAPPAPRRVMGPAPPPVDLAERPSTDPHRSQDTDSSSDSDDDSDDDYGPALPGTTRPSTGPSLAAAQAPEEPARPKRDDWMLAPPTSSGYQERDPTKIRSRKFASGASATSRPKDGSAGGGISSIWTETPEEKAKRLKDAVLGRGGGGGVSEPPPPVAAAKSKKAGSREQQEKIRAFTEQARGRSLYDEHQASKKSGKDAGKEASKGDGKGEEEEDDDPSKRAFDREKDMGLGMKITASQRKELLNRASDFGGRFQKGNFL